MKKNLKTNDTFCFDYKKYLDYGENNSSTPPRFVMNIFFYFGKLFSLNLSSNFFSAKKTDSTSREHPVNRSASAKMTRDHIRPPHTPRNNDKTTSGALVKVRNELSG